MIERWLLGAAGRLTEAGIDAPQLEARMLLQAVLKVGTEQLILGGELAPEDSARADALLDRRLTGEPMAYVVGYKEFFGKRFRVDSSVLVPRPETELLVEVAIESASPGARCADIGTGSGCVGISAQVACPGSYWACTDVSAGALRVAQSNADGVPVTLIQANLLDAFADASLDVIVSNPPYVRESDPDLDAGVARWEPGVALYGGSDGLDVVRSLVAGSLRVLAPCGVLAFEIGICQADAAVGMLDGWGPSVRKDLVGIDRVVVGRKP